MTMEHGIARLVEDSGFRDEVLRELSGDRCAVPCRWLYDDRGSEQFEDITRLEEYYPTRTEVGILREAATPVGTFAGPAGARLIAAFQTAAIVAAVLAIAAGLTAFMTLPGSVDRAKPV